MGSIWRKGASRVGCGGGGKFLVVVGVVVVVAGLCVCRS